MASTKRTKKIIIVIWLLFILFFGGIATTFLMVQNDAFNLFGGLPSLEALEKPDPDLSSELLSADGVSLGKYFRTNRTPVTYEELSPELINTLMVTEDVRFKEHSGIDLKSLLRAASGVLTAQFKGGGSTLTMQLAENLYKTSTANRGSLYDIRIAGSIVTKLKEYIIAVKLEQAYTKEEILAMYLNTVPFGSNSFGIKVAAKTFFNKLPSQLTYKEAAVLVGSINAPTRFNPVYNPDNAMAKRTEVLYNLFQYDIIDRETFDSLNAEPFGLNYRVDNQNEGLATYFRSVIKNFLLNWTRENGYDLYDDGLKIYTTIDSRLQAYAEAAMEESMDTLQAYFMEHLEGDMPWIDQEGEVIENFIEDQLERYSPHYKRLVKRFGEQQDSIDYYIHKKRKMRVFSWEGDVDTLFSTYDSMYYYKHFLQAGFMAMEPKTGHIKAWVGGINHKYFKYDHVQRGKRQPGSTFKPIVYTAAIDNGYSPCYPVVDAAVTFSLPGQDPPTWTPDNANNIFTGEKMTIRRAMAASVNSATAYIMKNIGPETVVRYARMLGIESRLAAVPVLCLGAAGEVSLYEMLGAYSTFANKGNYTKPFYISRIEDQNGNVLQQFVPEPKEALNEETAYLMLHMLKGAFEEQGGSGHALAWSLKQDNEIGAKTGTTQNASDGWFIGVTHDLVAGAWVGGDNRSIHFKHWTQGQGARTARPIYQRFMLKVYDDKTLPYKKGYFEKPLQPLSVELDCSLYDNTNPTDSLALPSLDEDEFYR